MYQILRPNTVLCSKIKARVCFEFHEKSFSLLGLEFGLLEEPQNQKKIMLILY